mgnify:CR=1 FL=1
MDNKLEMYEKPIIEVVEFTIEETITTDISGEGLFGSALVCQMTEV